ncbi:histidine phosphatase family protein [bacterium]|nr:histidine phosphatase family protein [bacterium]
MSHLILIRHSLSHQQPAVSSHDWTLTPAGIERCEHLAAHIQPYSITGFYSSAEPKARLTAEHTARALNVTHMEILPALHEQKRDTAPYYQNVGGFSGSSDRRDAPARCAAVWRRDVHSSTDAAGCHPA